MKMSSTIPIIILITGYILQTSAQNPEWINYTNGDEINAIAEDEQIIWIGTAGGLVRIETESGKTDFYNKCNGLPDNHVVSIATDSNGVVWIGTKVGLTRFDGAKWTVFDTLNSGLTNSWRTCILIIYLIHTEPHTRTIMI